MRTIKFYLVVGILVVILGISAYSISVQRESSRNNTTIEPKHNAEVINKHHYRHNHFEVELRIDNSELYAIAQVEKNDYFRIKEGDIITLYERSIKGLMGSTIEYYSLDEKIMFSELDVVDLRSNNLELGDEE